MYEADRQSLTADPRPRPADQQSLTRPRPRQASWSLPGLPHASTRRGRRTLAVCVWSVARVVCSTSPGREAACPASLCLRACVPVRACLRACLPECVPAAGVPAWKSRRILCGITGSTHHWREASHTQRLSSGLPAPQAHAHGTRPTSLRLHRRTAPLALCTPLAPLIRTLDCLISNTGFAASVPSTTTQVDPNLCSKTVM